MPATALAAVLGVAALALAGHAWRAARVARESALRARLQATLAELGQKAMAGLPGDEFLAAAARLVARGLGTELAAVLELLPGTEGFSLRAGEGFPAAEVGRARFESAQDSLAGHALRSGHPLAVEDLSAQGLFKRAPLLDSLGARSGMGVAIATGAGPWGVLAVYARAARVFTLEELYFLQAASNVVGTSIERRVADEALRKLNVDLEARVARRTAELEEANAQKDRLIAREQEAIAKLEDARAREVELGARIQRLMLLDQPPIDLPGLRVAALTVPAREICGDFFDFHRTSGQLLDVLVADVMGKGVPAALLAAATRSHFLEARAHLMGDDAAGLPPEPAEIIAMAHARIVPHLISLESFVTVGYVRLDMARRSLAFVDCGHTGLLHWRPAAGATELVHGENLPLGVREDESFVAVTRPFEPGDVLVLFSDGITDAKSPTGERYGLARLRARVEAGSRLPPDELAAGIKDEVLAFAGTDRPDDDLTVVVVGVTEREAPGSRAQAELASRLDQLARARGLIRKACFDAVPPVDERTVAGLELAVTEALSNVIRHAYHGSPDQQIELEVETFPRYVAVRVYHQGESFRPGRIRPPDVEGLQESGFGLFLIHQTVDEVRYSRDAQGRNCIAMVKARAL